MLCDFLLTVKLYYLPQGSSLRLVYSVILFLFVFTNTFLHFMKEEYPLGKNGCAKVLLQIYANI